MSKILLTGSSGFVGSNILEKLSKKNNFYILVRKNPKKKFKNNKNIKIIKFHSYTSLNNKLKKIKVNTVIHCATHYVKNHEYKDLKKINLNKSKKTNEIKHLLYIASTIADAVNENFIDNHQAKNSWLKLINSNILLGNIILENLNKMNVKKFINFSTIWEDSNAIPNNSKNLYAAYKKGFGAILNFYKKRIPSTAFIELMLTDTFGLNDTRDKIINTLKKNYLKKKVTKIVSKNLYLNILNIEDIIDALQLILQKNIKSNKFILKNSFNLKILDLINTFNRKKKKYKKN